MVVGFRISDLRDNGDISEAVMIEGETMEFGGEMRVLPRNWFRSC